MLGDDERPLRPPADGRRSRAVGARRERHGDDQLHLRHHRPTQGRADHAPQHLDQRGHVRAARRRHRPRRLPAHAADVPRQRVGDAVRDDRPRREERRAAQGRRRRDPAPGREARRHRDVRRARRGRRRARGRPDLGGRDPRPRQGPDHHGRRAAADEDRGPGGGGARAGSSSRSTASPRPRRCSPSTAPAPSGTTSPPRSGRRS